MNDLPDPESSREVSVAQVASWHAAIERGEMHLIDCREPDEWDRCHLPAARLVPLSDFPTAIAALDDRREAPWIVYCHHGMRSLRAVEWLRQRGQSQVWSMHGGIHAWSQEIDPAVPTY